MTSATTTKIGQRQQDRRRKLMWFIALYCAGLAAVSLLAYALKLLLPHV